MNVLPTLELMASLYALPRSGGAKSTRFKRFVEAAQGESPVGLFNPMAGDDARSAVQALLDHDAEAVAAAAVDDALEAIGMPGTDLSFYIVVGAIGMWTDQFLTEIEHRLKWTSPGCIYIWTDRPISTEYVRSEAMAEAVRCAYAPAAADTEPLEMTIRREGSAASLSGAILPELDVQAYDRTVAIAEEHRQAIDLGTKVAVLYGDDVAKRGGWTPLGVPRLGGYVVASLWPDPA